MTRDESTACAKDTVECTNNGKYMLGDSTINIDKDIQLMMERTKLYRLEPLYINRSKGTDNSEILFSGKTTIKAAKDLSLKYRLNHYKIGILNFASAKHPGGGFLNGSMAQEESIARVSTLYPSLLKFFDFYKYNRQLNSALYSDLIIYSENVTVFKNDNGDYLPAPFNIDIITSPAPNANAVKSYEPNNINKIHDVLENRIRKILTVAVLNNIDCLVLGAFGCGVFGNDFEDVVNIFKQILIDEDFQKYFKVIEFAIYDKDSTKYLDFQDIFEE